MYNQSNSQIQVKKIIGKITRILPSFDKRKKSFHRFILSAELQCSVVALKMLTGRLGMLGWLRIQRLNEQAPTV